MFRGSVRVLVVACPHKIELTTPNVWVQTCIRLAVHVEDLRLVLDAHERTIEVDGQTLINVQRYTEFTNLVKELHRLPPPDLERYRHQGELAYLESKLAGVQIGEAADRELRARAQSLKTVEDVLNSQRIREKLRAGFSVSAELKRSVTG